MDRKKGLWKGAKGAPFAYKKKQTKTRQRQRGAVLQVRKAHSNRRNSGGKKKKKKDNTFLSKQKHLLQKK